MLYQSTSISHFMFSSWTTIYGGIRFEQHNNFNAEMISFQQQRRLDLLTITDPSNVEDGVEQRVVFFTARVHPGESPASYICQGEK